MHSVILIGAGEHARVVLDSLQTSKREVVALFDPKYDGQKFMNVPVFGEYQAARFPEAQAILAVGSNAARKKLSTQLSHSFTISKDSSAIISSHATIGEGSMVLHGVIVQQGTSVGKHVILNTGSRIDHDCKIGDFVHIAPGTILCGRIAVGEGTLLGAGSTIIPGTTIGAWCTVGAGSVVTKDLPDYAVAVGNPARIIKYNTPQ